MTRRTLVNQSGMSLTNVLLGALVGGVLLAIVFQAINSSYQISSHVNAQTNIDSLHNTGVQMARNSKLIRRVLRMESDPNNPLPIDQSLVDCFNLKGMGCSSRTGPLGPDVANNNRYNFNKNFMKNGSACPGNVQVTGPSDSCPIQRKTTYKINCNGQNKCESVDITVSTAFSPLSKSIDGQHDIAERTNTITISGALLMGLRKDIDFSCAQGQFGLVTKIDFVNFVASCSPITFGDPKPKFGSFSCGNGIATLGLFPTQDACPILR
ncbi:MAG: hypothetical protein RJB66_1971 [Pseudomonadota bacterium]